MSAEVPSSPHQRSTGRKIYRSFAFALMVGVVGAGLSVVPGLFIQSIFIGNAQRCEEQQQLDITLTGEIQTDCAENLSTTPEWLPPTIIAGGGLMGFVGGFLYGFLSPRSAPGRPQDREVSWLPF